jgi:hypothetical protein
MSAQWSTQRVAAERGKVVWVLSCVSKYKRRCESTERKDTARQGNDRTFFQTYRRARDLCRRLVLPENHQSPSDCVSFFWWKMRKLFCFVCVLFVQ